MTYRGYSITREQTPHGEVIWVDTRDGPIDVGSVIEARKTIDRIIEEETKCTCLDEPLKHCIACGH